eukprot:TRINITY_DN1940_c0_g2_i3.p2 TRINITY_DN1940_c0_g2~~TRINITY_DN1940_c0_g2_i3.p2  ORF type:complete len:266 (+),score=47.33 TRINITY_DN1940_c0_g2_i3:50-847(+)
MDDYCKTVARATVCQLSHGLGLEHLQQSAVTATTEVLMKYLGEVGRHCKFYTELSGRTDPNISDVVFALEDMQTPLREVIDYARKFKEFEFVFELGNLAYQQEQIKQQETFGEASEIVPAHIPDFLPRFPPVHTYQATPSFVVPVPEERNIARSAGVERREAEKALAKFLLEDKNQQANDTGAVEEIMNSLLQPLQEHQQDQIVTKASHRQDAADNSENVEGGVDESMDITEEDQHDQPKSEADVIAQRIIEQGPDLELDTQKDD